MEEVDEFICSDTGCSGCSDTYLCAGCLVKETCWLVATISIEECILFLVTDPAGKLASHVALEVEGRIVQELLGNLDEGTYLVGIQVDLAEGFIGLLECILFLHPCSLSMRCYDRDLVYST